MQYRVLGRTDLSVSELALGCAPFGMTDYISRWDPSTAPAEKEIVELVHRAVDLGYNYFDTAPAYGGGRSEELLGMALQGIRGRAIIATKIGLGVTDLARNREYWSPLAIQASVESSLGRLGTDVIDVIQLHGGDYSDGEDHLVLEQGVLEALQTLQSEGKVRFLAFTTEGSTGAVERLVDSGAFDVIQLPYNLMNVGISDFEKGHGLVRRAHAQGMGITVMRPMTGGVFMRLMRRHFPELDPNALGALLLNYVLSDPFITSALVGTRSQARLESNLAISDDLASRLDLDEYFWGRRKSE